MNNSISKFVARCVRVFIAVCTVLSFMSCNSDSHGGTNSAATDAENAKKIVRSFFEKGYVNHDYDYGIRPKKADF